MISVGQPAPAFDAPATTGEPISLAKLRGKIVVLYFFPKAFTSG
ncbi:MAG: redoxin domain-containing protein [Polyangiaceae bacterium]|nr:redoxin domain-containing protein [Polyangiaceae bacterium]